jgi:L-gulonate 3-dehydrogenase
LTGKMAILGAGLIGRSWAMVFARAGWQVKLTDSSEDARAAAPHFIAQGLADLAAAGLTGDAPSAAARISLVASLQEAVADVEIVQECLPEALEAKRAVFAELDRAAAPATILASSTSAILPSAFTAELLGRARCLVAHPVNPPHLVPLVELCGAPWTAPDTIRRAHTIFAAAGQTPIVVNREVEGFVLNRLQGALLTEALRLVGDGVFSPQDLDKTMKDGLGLRWSFMGPFETIELNPPDGIPDYVSRYGGFYGRIAADPPDPGVWDTKRSRGLCNPGIARQACKAVAPGATTALLRSARTSCHRRKARACSPQDAADGSMAREPLACGALSCGDFLLRHLARNLTAQANRLLAAAHRRDIEPLMRRHHVGRHRMTGRIHQT